MDAWMSDFISNDASKSLAEFVDNLRDTINRVAGITEKQRGYFIHIAGYAVSGSSHHPEFYQITNCPLDPQTGNYPVLDTTLYSQEDFWRQNSLTPLNSQFTDGKGENNSLGALSALCGKSTGSLLTFSTALFFQLI